MPAYGAPLLHKVGIKEMGDADEPMAAEAATRVWFREHKLSEEHLPDVRRRGGALVRSRGEAEEGEQPEELPRPLGYSQSRGMDAASGGDLGACGGRRHRRMWRWG